MLFVSYEKLRLIFGVTKELLEVRRYIHSLFRILNVYEKTLRNNVDNRLDQKLLLLSISFIVSLQLILLWQHCLFDLPAVFISQRLCKDDLG